MTSLATGAAFVAGCMVGAFFGTLALALVGRILWAMGGEAFRWLGRDSETPPA